MPKLSRDMMLTFRVTFGYFNAAIRVHKDAQDAREECRLVLIPMDVYRSRQGKDDGYMDIATGPLGR